MDLTIGIKPFDELTKRELYELMVLRNQVFVVGQKITAEPEVDGRDPECHHVLMWSGDELVATARIFAEHDPVTIGRVAVALSRQRLGLGTRLMQAVQQFLGSRRAELHAQAHLEPWYTRLGWQRTGPTFCEAEIPHVRMIWAPKR